MTEETDAPQGGTDGIVTHETLDDPSQVEAQTSDDTAEQQTEADKTGQADETGDTPKRKPWWEKRFDELTAKRYEAEREAAYYRGIAEGRTPQAQPQAEQAPPDRWDDPEGYDRWLINEAATRAREELTQTQRLSTYGEKVAKFSEAHPDFAELVTHNRDLSVTPNMANVIFESDYGPQVAYHLGQNPQEARRIAALPDYRQAAELGKLEATLSQPKAQQQRTPPPPPPQTVGGVSAGLTKTMEEMSFAEFKAMRDKEEREQR